MERTKVRGSTAVHGLGGRLGSARGLSAPLCLALAAVLCLLPSCGKGGGGAPTVAIQNTGSDTMVNLAQMWAEEYRKAAPGVTVEVAGGGTGVGIRDLMQGVVAVANASREMDPAELEQAKQKTGKAPVEWIVAYDALAIYVHKDNPVDTLTLDELAGIYGETGKVDKWSQLGVDMKSIGGNDEIVRISRQNSSGTYAYFREKVLNKKDFKMGSKDMSGSKDVVELVARTKGAIGYSGMGYLMDGVKFVKVAVKKGEAGHPPSLENVQTGKYPLARPLVLYTLGQPDPAVKAYIDWILSPAGQEMVRKSGDVPVAGVQKAADPAP
jgi:phosphate transport system substrate-binding protein